MTKILSLSVHRNTQQQRISKSVRDGLMRDARDLANTKDIAGYAIVVWTKDWDHRTLWESGKTMPGNVLPEFCKGAILREMMRDDARKVLDSTLAPDEGA